MRRRDFLLLVPLVLLGATLGLQAAFPARVGPWAFVALVPASAAPILVFLLLERRRRKPPEPKDR